MRTDILIGITLSALIHAGAFFGGPLFPRNAPATKPAEKKSSITLTQVPRFDPEEPETVEFTDDAAKPVDFAPPMRADMPQVVTDISFVQPVQPPPPENVKVAAGMAAIPDRRSTRDFANIRVFDPASLDQTPQPRLRTPPPYPHEMKRHGITGHVLVDFIVDSTGAVQNAYAFSSSDRGFEQAAIQGVMKWRFKPGMKGGRAVNTHMQVPIHFNLEDTR